MLKFAFEVQFSQCCHQRFAACRSGGFSAQKLLKIPELSTSTKVSKKALNPPFLQTAVVCGYSFFTISNSNSLFFSGLIVTLLYVPITCNSVSQLPFVNLN